MGTWSGEPFGNDAAGDFGWELDDQKRWNVVKDALQRAVSSGAPLDADTACIAIAAAEVVAHGLGRPTQNDAYTDSAVNFVARARRPSARLAATAARAVEVASSPDGELAELWAEGDEQEWRDANARLLAALTGR
ncbi:DUF4259 domain-containing protein [Marisediminicola senii]|uniref:DUF4259 domain-containing protein n=1 Tax=Marisediminicola senii TaxID=2711233 RepID=UPI0013EAC6A3|nr:DUF4259 domain-containing protein [Marisediminicola senii]